MGANINFEPCIDPIEKRPPIEPGKNQILLAYDRYRELKQAEEENNKLRSQIEQLQKERLYLNNDHTLTLSHTSDRESSPIAMTTDISADRDASTAPGVGTYPDPNPISINSIYDKPNLNSAWRIKPRPREQIKKKVSHIIDSSELKLALTLPTDQPFDGKCTNIHSCIAIKRTIKILRWYSFCGDDHEKLLIAIKDNKYDIHLLNDYHHILGIHLNNKDIKNIKYEFDLIHNEILKYVKPCELKECEGFIRHHRRREKNDGNNVSDESELQFYIDTMDSIHCYFMHSYDTAMRHKMELFDRSNIVKSVFDDEDEKYDQGENVNPIQDEPEFVDEKMKNMKAKLKQKWEDLNSIVHKNNDNGNKFFTKLKSMLYVQNVSEKHSVLVGST